MDTPGIRIVRERLVYESRYGALYDDEVEFLPQAVPGTYLRWQWKSPFSVAVLPILPSGEIVLVENFRHSARRPVLEVPKGFGRPDATPRQVAEEELAQETGLRSTQFESTGKVATDAGFAYAPFHLFIARQCAELRADPEDSEVIVRLARFPVVQTRALLTSGEIEDAVTIILLQQLILAGADHDHDRSQALSE